MPGFLLESLTNRGMVGRRPPKRENVDIVGRWDKPFIPVHLAILQVSHSNHLTNRYQVHSQKPYHPDTNPKLVDNHFPAQAPHML